MSCYGDVGRDCGGWFSGSLMFSFRLTLMISMSSFVKEDRNGISIDATAYVNHSCSQWDRVLNGGDGVEF